MASDDMCDSHLATKPLVDRRSDSKMVDNKVSHDPSHTAHLQLCTPLACFKGSVMQQREAGNPTLLTQQIALPNLTEMEFVLPIQSLVCLLCQTPAIHPDSQGGDVTTKSVGIPSKDMAAGTCEQF